MVSHPLPSTFFHTYIDLCTLSVCVCAHALCAFISFCYSQQYLVLYNSFYFCGTCSSIHLQKIVNDGIHRFPLFFSLLIRPVSVKFFKPSFHFKRLQNSSCLFFIVSNSFFVVPILVRTQSFVACFRHDIFNIHSQTYILGCFKSLMKKFSYIHCQKQSRYYIAFFFVIFSSFLLLILFFFLLLPN